MRLLIRLLNGASCFAAGQEGSIVTRNGRVISSKHKTKAR